MRVRTVTPGGVQQRRVRTRGRSGGWRRPSASTETRERPKGGAEAFPGPRSGLERPRADVVGEGGGWMKNRSFLIRALRCSLNLVPEQEAEAEAGAAGSAPRLERTAPPPPPAPQRASAGRWAAAPPAPSLPLQESDPHTSTESRCLMLFTAFILLLSVWGDSHSKHRLISLLGFNLVRLSNKADSLQKLTRFAF